MKKYSTLFAVIFTILFVALLTWILPITYLNGQFVTDARSPMGIVDLFTYPSFIIYNFIYVLFYILIVGAFYAVLNKTGAYRQILDGIVKFLKGKEIIFLSITVLLISTIVAFTGFTYEAILIFPFLFAIVLMLGYDKITASLVTLGPVLTGVMGSMFSNTISGQYLNILNANGEVVTYTDLIWAKIIIIVVINAILVLNVIFHAKKNKVKKVEESIFIPSKETVAKKKWPLIVILSFALLVVIMATINWTNAFKITFFTDILEKLQSLTIGGYDIWNKILGSIVAFGSWSYNEIMIWLLFIVLIIKLVYRVKFEELFDAMFDGTKNYLYAALIVLLAYTVLISTSNNPVMLTILKPLLQITDGFNSVTLALSTFVSALFSTDFTFHNYTILPLTYVTTFINDTSVYALCGLITQSMNGLAMLIAPTSAVLLFNLSILKISYLEWLKNIWKLFLEMLVVLFIVFTVILLII